MTAKLAQMIGKAVRGPGHQQPNGYVPQVRGVLRAVDGDEGLVEEGQSLRRTRCPLVSLVLDETTEQALAAEDGPGGSLHWAQVPDAGGTRLVWTSFGSLDAAIRSALHYRECPALRHGVAPIVHEARKPKGVRVDVYL